MGAGAGRGGRARRAAAALPGGRANADAGRIGGGAAGAHRVPASTLPWLRAGWGPAQPGAPGAGGNAPSTAPSPAARLRPGTAGMSSSCLQLRGAQSAGPRRERRLRPTRGAARRRCARARPRPAGTSAARRRACSAPGCWWSWRARWRGGWRRRARAAPARRRPAPPLQPSSPRPRIAGCARPPLGRARLDGRRYARTTRAGRPANRL